MTRLKNGQHATWWAGRQWLWRPKTGSIVGVLLLSLLVLTVGFMSDQTLASVGTTPTGADSTPSSTPVATRTPLPPTAPPPPLLQVSKRVYLWRAGGGEGMVAPGDELLYAFTVTNLAGETVGAVSLRDELGAGALLVPGTIVASRGQVVAGNAAGDGTAIIEFGDLEAGGRVLAQLRVLVTAGAAGQIANQAVVSYRYPVNGTERFGVSDNPDTAEPDDPTIIAVRPSGPAVYLPMIGRE